jgi:hypothetical protein
MENCKLVIGLGNDRKPVLKSIDNVFHFINLQFWIAVRKCREIKLYGTVLVY